MSKIGYSGYRFPPEIIHRVHLSIRHVGVAWDLGVL